MTESDDDLTTRQEEIRALFRVVMFRPSFSAAIIAGGVVTALMEGIGLSFVLPIVSVVEGSGDPSANASGAMGVFVTVYDWLGIPFSLGYVVAGVSVVLIARWTLTFFIRWLRAALAVDYTRELQVQAFDSALDARIAYFDSEGSDDILNAIVTQAEYAGRVIQQVVEMVQQALLSLMYLLVAFLLAPVLTLFALVFLGGLSLLFRLVIESGYNLGDEVADANERIQEVAQAGTQGIRDTKLFIMRDELYADFVDAVDQYANRSITLRRNEQAIQNFYNLLTAVSVFLLIYLAIRFANMSLGSLGVFLFAIFRLGPKVSGLNSKLYRVENFLPHLVRTQNFIDELRQNSEPLSGPESVPEEVREVCVENLTFTYDGQDEPAIENVSFTLKKGEFLGFVGQSGAGKSTIVSILTRVYEPDSGRITANGRSIQKMDIQKWRSRIAVVRQDPFIFNDTLRYNLTIGNRDTSAEELKTACRIAKIDEFIEELPNGYDSQLGDDGVRLSGGQRQRVALARALLKDAEILILDEATSDLDSDLEKQVQRSIEAMEREYAIVSIAHRLSTVKNADRIYTIEDGEIIETGTHQELLGSDGKYARLYEIQSKG